MGGGLCDGRLCFVRVLCHALDRLTLTYVSVCVCVYAHARARKKRVLLRECVAEYLSFH